MSLGRRELLGAGLAGVGLLATGCTPSTGEAGTTTAATTAATTATPPAFPAGFAWGVATSAYQVEGSVRADGRSPSIWDTFAASGNRIADGSSGAEACDHYRRWRTDLDLMGELGIGSYRFSIAWPRIQPGRDRRTNPAGLAFYDRLVDGLLDRGIAPVATLYHWDLPQHLEDAGGWESRDSAGWFADYAGVMFEALGDRVGSWVTINESKVIVEQGYQRGWMAPGKNDLEASGRVLHHLNLAHGRAVAAFRASTAKGTIGPCFTLAPCYPADDSEGARAATALADLRENRLYLDPVLLGRYPDDLELLHGEMVAGIAGARRDGDDATIGPATDFVGVNYYSPVVMAATGPAQPYPLAANGWQQLHPDGLRDVLLRVHRDYDAPVQVVLENGIPDARGQEPLHDPERIDFLKQHLQAAAGAIGAGARLNGYHAWSLLDNFEWAAGYTQRYGLVHVDFESQRRTPKDSARWYAAVIRANGVPG
ncbi:MAG: beta-glucosidase [Propionibacteriaceae bacterium]|nr:beta-glucosidase [Propionibacteriaceae bacterium]